MVAKCGRRQILNVTSNRRGERRVVKDESRAMTRTLLTAALYALILAAIIYAVANGGV